jgi:hypothetical protein
VSVPEVPVMVIVDDPVAAVLLADKVSVLLVVVLAGLNDAVTPLGNPLAERATLPVKPFIAAMETVVAPLAPCTTLSVAGDTEMPKFAAAVTVSVTVVVCERLPEVPVMVIVDDPVAAVLLADRVSVLVPVVLAGLNDAVTPLGSPLAERATLPVKPFVGATVMVVVLLLPCTIERLVGDAERLKFPAATVPASALIMPWPFGVPHPVTRSNPVNVEKRFGLPLFLLLPVVMSWKAVV